VHVLRGWFVDRHFYQHDSGGRGRYVTFTRRAQLRWATAAGLLLALTVGLAAVLAWSWLHLPDLAPGRVALPAMAAQGPAADDATAALRTALDESRQKRAELAAQLESLRRQPAVPVVPVGPTQAEFDRIQALYDETVARAESAEASVAAAEEEAVAARREAAVRAPIDESTVPDRIRALELELEAVRAEQVPPAAAGDAVDMAFTPEEEAQADRIQELEATVAELEAERDALERRIAELTGQPPPGNEEPAAEPAPDPAPDDATADEPDPSGEGSDPDQALPDQT
jgi:hypothetical protein